MKRAQPTMADTVFAGIAPALIIGMISCLVFFLITIVYQGEFSFRLMYILGLYTFGSVLIARIAIEQTRALAASYTAAIGLATLFVVMRFVEFRGALAPLSIPIVIGFLVLIGYLADRITFDCTLIDESDDGSGEGLLQSLGLIRSSIQTKKKRHNPGVWVLYFSILALPLFGLGQLAIPASNAALRGWVFWFLFGYLFCSLGLLLLTSFLGLRRYLRQRQVPMPTSMISTWFVSGGLGILGLLIVASILPLPGRSAGLIELPRFLTSPSNLTASRYGWGSEGVRSEDDSPNGPVKDEGNPSSAKGENENRKSDEKGGDKPSSSESKQEQSRGESDPKGASEKGSKENKESSPSEPRSENKEQKSQGNPPSEKKQDADAEKEGKREQDRGDKNPRSDEDPKSEDRGRNNQGKSEKKSEDKASNEDKRSEGTKERESDAPSTSPPKGTDTTSFRMPELPSIIKWITVLLLCIVLFVYSILNWDKLLAALRALFHQEEEAQGASNGSEHSSSTPLVPDRTFASFLNPFGGEWKGNPDGVIRHTFEAVEAWGREQGLPRQLNETPEEFLRRLASRFATESESFLRLAQQYNGLAYAGGRTTSQEAVRLKGLWGFLTGGS